jgi:hypothetical protein
VRVQQLDVRSEEASEEARGNVAGSVGCDMPFALAEELETAAERVRKRLKNMSTEIIEIGRELREVKQRLEHGGFLKWVDKACQLSPRTAQLMMNAAEWVEGRHEIVTHLEPTAIYLLAAPSTPETVRNAVLSQIEQGQKLPSSAVKEMIRAAKAAKLTPREKNSQRRDSGQQHDAQPEYRQPHSQQDEQPQPQSEKPIEAERAAATDELMKMLGAWSRFSDFIALLGKADVSKVVQFLRDGINWQETDTAGQASVTNPAHILLGSPEAAADDAANDCVGLATEAMAAEPCKAAAEITIPEHLEGAAEAVEDEHATVRSAVGYRRLSDWKQAR